MRYLHTMLRVKDLDASIRFYSEVLGLSVHSRKDYPDGKFTLVFLGSGGDSEGFLELTHNWGVSEYTLGTAFGHIAFGVPNVASACEAIQSMGGKITRAPGPMKHGSTVIAFVEDPDGYKIELIERAAF